MDMKRSARALAVVGAAGGALDDISAFVGQSPANEKQAQIRQATGQAFSWRNPTLVGDITSGTC